MASNNSSPNNPVSDSLKESLKAGLCGSIVAIVTPMQPSNQGSMPSIDLARLKQLCQWHLAEGTNGIVVMGTTGESASVSEVDYLKAIEVVVKTVAKRVPVIAGTGAISTTKTMDLTTKAAALGADAALVVTPYYCKPSQEGLYLHFKAVADNSSVPLILYNVPGRTACDLLPTTVARLAEYENIVAIKEATGDVSRVKELIEVCKTPIQLLSGDDATAREFIQAGGHGVISVTANVAPALMSQMCQLALDGQQKQAAIVDQKLSDLHRDLFLEANPIPVKWALAAMGKVEDAIMMPLTSLNKEFQPAVLKALEKANVKTQ
ncbi:4-hydroxy-tetrahydrodipicolinate synthase [Kangiella sp. TOML190]|uniref:4-hydroxy-tetrahydrodipicolinate synthase n=1 Tax=Kangiella sp. TOML190 TaxID=2931351 RepID=UPI00203B69D8|nr:4-hydroxy-tetrahydrodipicolinate synthase [Kangiella sp. TOML190]